jgi:fructose-bisphosphate aldolase class II
VALHLDHGSKLDSIIAAIRFGFSSVMIDASTKSFQENIELTKKVVEIAHSIGISVEAELGTIAGYAFSFTWCFRCF